MVAMVGRSFGLALILLAPCGLVAFIAPQFPSLSPGETRLQDSVQSLQRHRERVPYLSAAWTGDATATGNLVDIEEIIRERKIALEATRRSLYAKQLALKVPPTTYRAEAVQPNFQTWQDSATEAISLGTVEPTVTQEAHAFVDHNAVSSGVSSAFLEDASIDHVAVPSGVSSTSHEDIFVHQDAVQSEVSSTLLEDTFVHQDAVQSEVSSTLLAETFVHQDAVPTGVSSTLLEDVAASGIGGAGLGFIAGSVLQVHFPELATSLDIPAPLMGSLAFGAATSVGASMQGRAGDLTRDHLGKNTKALGVLIKRKVQDTIEGAKQKVQEAVNAVLNFPAFVGNSIRQKAEDLKTEITSTPDKIKGAAEAKAAEIVEEIQAIPKNIAVGAVIKVEEFKEDVARIPELVALAAQANVEEIKMDIAAIPSRTAEAAMNKVEEIKMDIAAIPSRTAEAAMNKVEEIKMEVVSMPGRTVDAAKAKVHEVTMDVVSIPGRTVDAATAKVHEATMDVLSTPRRQIDAAKAKVDATKAKVDEVTAETKTAVLDLVDDIKTTPSRMVQKVKRVMGDTSEEDSTKPEPPTKAPPLSFLKQWILLLKLD